MTANIKGCEDLSISEDVFVLVDENVDHPKCDFSEGPEIAPKLNVIKAKENCDRNTFFSSEKEAQKCVSMKLIGFFVHSLTHIRSYTLDSRLLLYLIG